MNALRERLAIVERKLGIEKDRRARERYPAVNEDTLRHEPVPPKNLQQGSIRHRQLPEDLLHRIEAFKRVLGDVDNISLHEVIEDFTRDAHPEREIAVWGRIASTYHLFLQHNPTVDLAVKHEIFSVLLMTSLGIETLNGITHLTQDQIQQLRLNYEGL